MCLHYPYFCCRNKIICILIAVFCKISDGQIIMLPWKQKYKHFELFFLFMVFVNQKRAIWTLYVSFIYSFAVKKYLDLKMVNT